MNGDEIPGFAALDHVHIHVRDRAEAEQWYACVLGFRRLPEYAFWAEGRGPLTISDGSERLHLALFERDVPQVGAGIALRVNAEEFQAWISHFRATLGRECVPVDHKKTWSIYVDDPDGNTIEITTYQYAEVASLQRGAGGA